MLKTLATSAFNGRLTSSTLSRASSFQQRYISKTSHLRQYEGDGKTTVSILNTDPDSPLMVDGYTTVGFKLNNGFHVRGPIAIFPKTVLSWDVEGAAQITPESLVLFTMLEPKLDILVIGVGNPGNQIPVETLQMLKKKKINFEIISTDHAITTFNFLNSERRCIAGAFLPPTKMKYREDEIVKKLKDKQKLYEKEPESKT